MYHRVGPRGPGDDPRLCVTRAELEAHLQWLERRGYVPCTAGAFEAWFQGAATLPQRSVLITFDDGFAGLHEHALPLLGRRGWPATVFLVSGLLGGLARWSGAAASHRLLTRAQVAELARHGFEFQSHSHTHPDLTTLDDAALAQQLRVPRQELEALLGVAVTQLAYPFGRFDARVQRAVHDAGYRLAFSVRPGFNRARGDALAVRRLDITGLDTAARFGRKLALGSNDGSLSAHLHYLASRALGRVTAVVR